VEPDPATVRATIRTEFTSVLGRQPSEQELATATEVYFEAFRAGRDADAVFIEWFYENYQNEIDLIARRQEQERARKFMEDLLDLMQP
jgi:hypothetical protein